MKRHPDTHRDFSLPAAAIPRLTSAAILGVVAGGLFLMIAGLVAAQPRLSWAGSAVLALAWVGRIWLQRRTEAEPSDRLIEQLAEDGPPIDDERAAELMALLEEWEEIEEKRGAPLSRAHGRVAISGLTPWLERQTPRASAVRVAPAWPHSGPSARGGGASFDILATYQI